MKTTVKEIKRILSESSKFVLWSIFEYKLPFEDYMDILSLDYQDDDQLNILEMDNYFAIWE